MLFGGSESERASTVSVRRPTHQLLSTRFL